MNGGGKLGSIAAVLGFDERHVVKSILRLGFRNVDSVHLMVPSEVKDRRTEEAIQRIRALADAAGVGRVEEHEIDYIDFDKAVLQVADILASITDKNSETVLSLGGGMRALVIEAYTAALSLPEGLRKHIRVVIDFETGKEFLEVWAHIPSYRPLSKEEIVILEEAERYGAAPSRISEKLGIPKSTAWKRLAQMVREGLLEKERRGSYRPTKKAKLLLSFMKRKGS